MRALIFQSQDRPEEFALVPEWGRNGKPLRVLVRAMSGTQRAIYEGLRSSVNFDHRRIYFEVVQMCCVHPRTKKPIFKVADRDETMDQKNGSIIDRLAMVALRLSQLLPSQQKAIEKNSEATQNSSGISNSPNDSATNE